MPKIIFTSEYMKSTGKTAAKNFVEYIATREGVEKMRENFVGYVGNRPGSHGLFSEHDGVDLKAAQTEVMNHTGTLWRHVVSLKREDAARLGFDNADAWKSLVIGQLPAIADNMKIPRKELKWYAAFHNTGHHPHIHLLVYSDNPKHGYLTEHGIENMRSAFANEIFKQDLIQIYQEKTVRRDKLKNAAEERMHELKDLPHADSPIISQKIDALAEFLKTYNGKAVYRYLPKDGKALVDDIFRELSRDPKIAGMYKSWCEMKDAVLSTYKDDLPEHGELTEQKDFYSIRNMIIREAQREYEYDESAQSDDFGEQLEDEYNIPTPQQSHAPVDSVGVSPGAAVRLLHHLSRIIQGQYDNNQRKLTEYTEKKLMRKIAQKKEAMGQKMD